MRRILNLIIILVVLFGCLVLVRFARAKYFGKKTYVTLDEVVEQTKNDLISTGEKINKQVEKVLGEKTSKENLVEEIQKELEQNEVIKELQKEVNTIVTQTTEKIRDLPKNEMEKIKKELKQEICKDLLEEKKP